MTQSPRRSPRIAANVLKHGHASEHPLSHTRHPRARVHYTPSEAVFVYEKGVYEEQSSSCAKITVTVLMFAVVYAVFTCVTSYPVLHR